jgi:hypothetical protein
MLSSSAMRIRIVVCAFVRHASRDEAHRHCRHGSSPGAAVSSVSWFLRGSRDVEKKLRHAHPCLQKLLFFYTVSA